MNTPIRIMGIDPGLRHTGWGLIEARGNALAFLASGTIAAPLEGTLAPRLAALFDALSQVVERQVPHEAAVEQTFVNVNPAAALKLGQARAIALLVPARAGLTVAEYAPNAIKKAVVGAGHAEKVQIRAMVRVLLPRADFDSDDAADALAVAICHAHHRQSVPLRILATT